MQKSRRFLMIALPIVVLLALTCVATLSLQPIREVFFSKFSTTVFFSVVPGMINEEVLDLLGTPHHIVDDGSGTIIWEYADGVSPDTYKVVIVNSVVVRTTVD